MGTLLYNRTCYSLLKSTLTIKELFSFAVKNDYHAIAITDKNVLFAAQIARYEAVNTHVKVIYGMETDVLYQDKICSFLVYAKNDEGFKQLSKLSTKISKEGKPILFTEFQNMICDCVVIIPDTFYFNPNYLHNDNFDNLRDELNKIKELMPNIFLGLSKPQNLIYPEGYKNLILHCQRIGIPIVAIPKALYSTEKGFNSYKAIMCIDQDKTFDDPSLDIESECHLLTPDELNKFSKEALYNTEIISQMCNVTFNNKLASLPDYPCPKGYNAETYLPLLAKKGLQIRTQGMKEITDYQKRLNYELKIIKNMGFSNYFLIVYDFILFSRKHNIYIGPGRGSAPGSLVAYCLGITHVDPLKYGLIFERFLNPQRATMPDIDTDVPDEHREDVINYLLEKYGEEHIAHITTFDTFGSRQAIQNVGKIMGASKSDLIRIKNLIVKGGKNNLRDLYKSSSIFRQGIEANSKYFEIFKLALGIEGLPTHLSIHAGGIVLAKEKLEDIVPEVKVNNQMLATQYTMHFLEPLGLIKMDILGISNLTIISNTVEAIKKNTLFDIFKIPLDDQDTFDIFKRTQTKGIFQSDSEGMRTVLRKVQPNSIEDIAICFALYRPGPMKHIDEYVARRNNKAPIIYPHPNLKPILQDTCGIMIYQEQIMQISQVMAGFSLSKADILRKAMSKKKQSEIESLKDDFINGCIVNGYTREVAQENFDLILNFAAYGFNKSHSIVYALFAYQMAYLKAHYPIQFYISLLNKSIGNAIETSNYLTEIKNRGIKILGPDLNQSNDKYVKEENGLRYPLTGIKSVTKDIVNKIIKEREVHGRYTDTNNAIGRLCDIKDKSVFISLIYSGAFDSFGNSRSGIESKLDNLILGAQLSGNSGFNLLEKDNIPNFKDSNREKAEQEKSVLGFYLTEHPLARVKKESALQVQDLITAISYKGNIRVIVEIISVKEHRTKNGDLMAFVRAQDETTDYNFTFMPNIYLQKKDYLKKGNIVYIEGVIDQRDSCLVKKCDNI